MAAAAASFLSSDLDQPEFRATLEVRGTQRQVVETTKDICMDVMLLLDVSGSMSGAPARTMSQEVLTLLTDGVLEPKDTVHVLTFNEQVQELQKPQYLEKLSHTDITSLCSCIASSGSGGTKLYTAMEDAIRRREAFLAAKAAHGHGSAAQHQSGVQKTFLLLVLTDGASADSYEPMRRRLASIRETIPTFQLCIVGIGLDEDSQAKLKAVTAADRTCCSFANVAQGAHASDAIKAGFHQHIRQRVVKQRQILRQLVMRSDGTAVLHQQERDQRGRLCSRANTTTFDASAALTQLCLGGQPQQYRALALPSAPAEPRAHRVSVASSAAEAVACPGSVARPPRCRFGANCSALQQHGKCTFFHEPREIPCKKGAQCSFRMHGKCAYKH